MKLNIRASAMALTCLDTTIRVAVKLQGGPWELEVEPERGGRIVSLRLGGVELLDQGIATDDPSATSFVGAGARGWDEMVPNVDPGPYPGPGDWEGVDLPDHGEAWRLPWAVIESTDSSASMMCSGRLLPWHLERRIELSDQAVHVSYVYRNLGGRPLFAYWCVHPLFKYETGMEIGVDGGERIARLPVGTSAKTFLPPGALDHVRLAWRSGTAVEVAWDASLTPYVGIWACNGDLGGYRHIAIEPATGGRDRPDTAAPPPLLAPGGELSWWLEVRDARGAGVVGGA